MSRSRPLRDLALAVTLLTVVPLRVSAGSEGERSDSASYFSAVGLLLGVLLLGVVWLANRWLYGLSGLAAALVLLALALVTRMLHWDGLADVADGWFVPRERRLDVMSDSAIGAFGAVAIVLVALVQWNALIEISSSATTPALVVLAPVFGRLAATFSAWLGKPARPGGLGRSVMGRPTAVGAVVTLSSVAAAVWIAFAAGAEVPLLAVSVAAGVLGALVVPHLIAGRFGGVTGDTMGASVLVVETLVFVAVLVVAGVLRLIGVSA